MPHPNQDQPATRATASPAGQLESRTVGPFDWLRQEVDHLFEEFHHHQQRSLFDWPASFMPRVPSIDLTDNGNEYQLIAELPGYEIKDISLELRDGSLLISASRETEKEEKKDRVLMRERQSGQIERLVPLPQSIDADGIKASLKDGVLTITLPKKAETKPEVRTIPIRT